ncbi:sentrin-specific protease 1-like isoform X2 [Phlebotomus papatasi]|uniref:sentrin-specific protease 1-like isoform X2 n=1 Tax=Phlebotomus papatasi TaxID=29031 RepID=UPI002483D829|nr:sentrin-specific protease 1-like isoform X2 [Phlebotomus papatasi]
MSSGGYIDRVLKALKEWGVKRRSEERDDDMEISKLPRIGDINRMSFGKTPQHGNTASSNPRRLTTSALLNKHLQGGHDFGSEILPKYDKLNLRTEFPNASSSFAQEQFIRKYNNQPLFLNRNADIEISDDEDVTYVPPMSKSNNFSNFSLGGPSTNGESRKSPTITQKPIPGLIPRSSVTKLKPIERFSRYSQPAERSSRFSSQREPSSLLTRASIYSGLNSFRMSTLRKSSAISKENRYLSRSSRMLHSVIKDSYNLAQRNNYKELLEKLAPSSMTKSRSLGGTQNKQKIVDTINLADYEFSDDEVPTFTMKSSTKTSTVLQESINNCSSKKAPIVAPINSKSITLSSSESPSRVSTPDIEPVNSVLVKLKSVPYFHDDWLAKQTEKSIKNREEYKKKIEEAEKLAKQYETERKKDEADFFIKKMKDIAISPPPIVIEDSEEEEPEFVLPELTPQQINLVKTVTQRGLPTEVIVSKFNLNITRQDLCTLVGDAWLNDEVINFYMNLLTERSNKDDSHLPKVYAMNTFFAVRLLQAGHAGVKRWTRKVDIFAHDVIPVPVHVSNVHWCMAIIHLKNRTIRYYDSMGQPNMRILDALEQYLKSESMDKKQRPFDMSGWEKECMADAPRQMNGSDCGVFSCMFAEYITRNCEISFSQSDMPYFRQKMIVEIATGKLLL